MPLYASCRDSSSSPHSNLYSEMSAPEHSGLSQLTSTRVSERKDREGALHWPGGPAAVVISVASEYGPY